MTGPRRREAVFDHAFLEDLASWARCDRRRTLRTLELANAVFRDPFGGPGKPEPLRGELSGCWSRRIDSEHRLVCQVTDDRVYFLAARYHY